MNLFTKYYRLLELRRHFLCKSTLKVLLIDPTWAPLVASCIFVNSIVGDKGNWTFECFYWKHQEMSVRWTTRFLTVVSCLIDYYSYLVWLVYSIRLSINTWLFWTYQNSIFKDFKRQFCRNEIKKERDLFMLPISQIILAFLQFPILLE